MITGFNTDVKQGDTVYHVQTEDKGANNPLILSLIYVKGTILDAFRTRYQDFLQSEAFLETTLQKILEFQHRQIVGAIKRGKYEKGMTLESYVDGEFVFQFQTTEAGPAIKAEPNLASIPVAATPPIIPVSPDSEPVPEEIVPEVPGKGAESALQNLTPPAKESSPIAALLNPVLRPLPEVSPEPVRHVSIDIATLSGEEGIEICVEGGKDFVGGELVDLHLYVQSRQSRLRIENVQIVVKIIGTTFSPRLYAGKTDRSGSLRMNFSLPAFSGGSAALIIQASTAIGNYEVKYLVKRRK